MQNHWYIYFTISATRAQPFRSERPRSQPPSSHGGIFMKINIFINYQPFLSWLLLQRYYDCIFSSILTIVRSIYSFLHEYFEWVCEIVTRSQQWNKNSRIQNNARKANCTSFSSWRVLLGIERRRNFLISSVEEKL